MIEPPSRQLIKTLSDLGLCTEREVVQCRSRVKAMARDLPAFDSVWLDALVHARKLTAFQARLIETGAADRLTVGDYVLFNELGHSLTAHTYLARHREDKTDCVLKVITQTSDEASHSLSRLQRLVEQTDRFQHPSILVPYDCFEEQAGLVVVSPFAPGPHLGELLVRRGRFPAPVVTQIASQLIDGLTALEKNNVVAGDLRLPNIRMSPRGLALLVDVGVAPAVSPNLVIHNRLAPERCDGIAPERIGTGHPATSATDVYALGCLLWHLLAGRPPFPTGDPLAKLASHQTSAVPDICDMAPDTPKPLAELITVLTARDPVQRPQTFAEIARKTKRPGRSSRHRLQEFHAQFNTPVARLPVAGNSSGHGYRWMLAASLLFVLSGVSLTLFDQGFESVMLSLTSRTGMTATEKQPGDLSTSDGDLNEGSQPETTPVVLPAGPSKNSRVLPAELLDLTPLPGPNASGTIQLEAGIEYAADALKIVGPVTIACSGKQPAQIVVGSQPWVVSAEQVTLQNLLIKSADSPALRSAETTLKSLVKLYSQGVAIQHCRFETPNDANTISTSTGESLPTAAIAWKAHDERDPSGSRWNVKETVFCGSGPALRLYSAARSLQVSNTLKQQAGPLMELAITQSSLPQMQMQLQQVTLREATALLALRTRLETLPNVRASIAVRNSVFDFAGKGVALVRVESNRPPRPEQLMIQITGESSIIGYDNELLVWNRLSSDTTARLVADSLEADGLIEAEYEFNGPVTLSPGTSQLRSTNIPRRSRQLPGIDSRNLISEGVQVAVAPER